MNRSFVNALVTGMFLVACLCPLDAGSPPAGGGKANILLIVADDLGYADLGFQGCKDIPTPHLDRLAREGLRCTSGYVTHPYCSPTRAALMTGRYQQRFGHEHNPWFDPDDHREGLPTSERLLPAFLNNAGYVTGWIGKWHLGAAPEFSPLKRGFKETFGFIGGGHHFQNWTPNPTQEYNVPILRNGEPAEVTNHLTLAFGDEAAAFIRRHKGEPWFLYLAFHAPHTPHEPTAERLARFASITNQTRRAYAAQVSLMDDAIGTTLTELRDTRQAERTLVFFFSDNGGPITVNGSINRPLRGAKGDVYEGGVRVPFLVSWPGRLPSGHDYAEPVSSVDVFATALALADAHMPTDRKYDSVNLLPFLTGEKSGTAHERLFWRTSRGRWATREGSFKLVRQTGKSDELYDLASDIGETNDLAAGKPEATKQLGNAVDAWNEELVPPAFRGLEARIRARPQGKPKQAVKP